MLYMRSWLQSECVLGREGQYSGIAAACRPVRRSLGVIFPEAVGGLPAVHHPFNTLWNSYLPLSPSPLSPQVLKVLPQYPQGPDGDKWVSPAASCTAGGARHSLAAIFFLHWRGGHSWIDQPLGAAVLGKFLLLLPLLWPNSCFLFLFCCSDGMLESPLGKSGLPHIFSHVCISAQVSIL